MGKKTAARLPIPCSAPSLRLCDVRFAVLRQLSSCVLPLLANLIIQKIWAEGVCFHPENHKSVTPLPPWGQAG